MRSKVEAYLDGEADAPQAMAVLRHLDQCWDCSEEAQWLILVKAAVRRWGSRRPADLAAVRLARLARDMLASL